MDEGPGMQDCVHQAAGDSSPALRAAIVEAPVAWMWQHDETGRVGFVDLWQVENGWQAANPRLRLISPLVFAENADRAAATMRPLQSQGREAPTGHALNSEAAKPLASSGPDEPTPDSAEPVSVELRQRMGRE